MIDIILTRMRGGADEPLQMDSVPERPETSGVLAPADLLCQLDSIKVAYRTLMSDYAWVIGESTKLGRARAGESDDTFKASARYNRRGRFHDSTLRLLTRAHVRKRLEELAARFAQLEATLDLKDSSTRSWLEQARADATSTAASLSTLRLPGIFVILPVLVGLVTATTKLTTDIPTGVWIGVGGAAVFVGADLYRDLRAAYRRKRDIFLEGASELDLLGPLQQQAHTGFNVYRDEDALFSALSLGRAREGPVDTESRALGIFLIAELCFLGAVLAESSVAAIGGLAGGFTMLVINIMIDRRAPKRLWR